jgi:hypothetical protein
MVRKALEEENGKKMCIESVIGPYEKTDKSKKKVGSKNDKRNTDAENFKTEEQLKIQTK